MNKKIIIASSAAIIILLISGGVWWLRKRATVDIPIQKNEVPVTATNETVKDTTTEVPVIQMEGPQGVTTTIRTQSEAPYYPLIDETVNVRASTSEADALNPPLQSVESSSTPDADSDGLTADQEATLGTDPNKADTDGDGLTDRQEVETYKTDPLKADTDGDNYSDGSEVQSGYNPLGSGKCVHTTCIP